MPNAPKSYKIIVLIFSVVTVLAATLTLYEKKNRDIDESIKSGLIYINEHYKNGAYEDQYLKYIYPEENIVCPKCEHKITYRILDGYFNVKFVSQLNRLNLTEEQTEDANNVLQELQNEWKNAPLYNTLAENKNGVAADTFCILGFIYKDSAFANNVLKHIKNGNLIDDNYYVQDKWRNIADETWCLRLLIATNPQNEVIRPMVLAKIKETDEYVKNNDEYGNFSVLYHMIYLLKEAGQKYDEIRKGYTPKNS